MFALTYSHLYRSQFEFSKDREAKLTKATVQVVKHAPTESHAKAWQPKTKAAHSTKGTERCGVLTSAVPDD